DGCEHRLVSVTRGDCEKAGELMRRGAGRGGLGRGGGKGGGGGGGGWGKKQLGGQRGAFAAPGLGFFHIAAKRHKARRAVYGEEDPKDEKAPGNAWAASVLHLAKRAGYVELEEAVWEWAFRWRGAKRKAALGLLSYMSARDDMIRYKEFLELGRQ